MKYEIPTEAQIKLEQSKTALEKILEIKQFFNQGTISIDERLLELIYVSVQAAKTS